IAGLADSIEHIGLLQPIGVTPDYQLIWGHRRMEAYWHLKRHTIPARIVPMDEIVLGEYAENEVRKDFTISERVSIKKTVAEKLKGRNHRPKKSSQNFDDLPKGRTDELSAKVAGFGNRQTARQAETVVDQGTPELVKAMDDGKVSISVAADVAGLPEEEQKRVMEQSEKAILQAAKDIDDPKLQENFPEVKLSYRTNRMKATARPKMAPRME
ncbi:MAG: ParB/RepB/Spo0J family partition protein, partial [Endozoicomonas sp.]